MAVFDECCSTEFTSVSFNQNGTENAWWIGGNTSSTADTYPETLVGKPVNDPTVRLLRLVADVYLTGPISVIGIVGNIVSFIVLCYNHKQRLRTVTILLQSLAVSDTLVLITGLFMRSFRHIFEDSLAAYRIWILAYAPTAAMMYVTRLVNTWLTVLLTIDRYIAVCHALHAQRLSALSVTNPILQIGAVTVFSLAFCMPRYFEYEIKYIDGEPQFIGTKLLQDKVYGVSYRIILFLFVQYFLPMILLVWLNGHVIWTLRKSVAYRGQEKSFSSPILLPMKSRNDKTNSPMRSCSDPVRGVGGIERRGTTASVTATTMQKSTRNVTIMVSIVVLMCIICNVIAMTSQVAWSVELAFTPPSPRLVLFRRYISNATNVIVTLNSAGNFIVYCMCSRDFRQVIARWIRFCFCGCSAGRRRRSVKPDLTNSWPRRQQLVAAAGAATVTATAAVAVLMTVSDDKTVQRNKINMNMTSLCMLRRSDIAKHKRSRPVVTTDSSSVSGVSGTQIKANST